MIYFLLAPELNRVKIGYTKNQSTLNTRIKSLQTGCPDEIKLLQTIPGGIQKEKQLHKDFEAHNQTGEWFDYCEEIQDFISALGVIKKTSFVDDDPVFEENKKTSNIQASLSRCPACEHNSKTSIMRSFNNFAACSDDLKNPNLSALAKCVVFCTTFYSETPESNRDFFYQIFSESKTEIDGAIDEALVYMDSIYKVCEGHAA